MLCSCSRRCLSFVLCILVFCVLYVGGSRLVCVFVFVLRRCLGVLVCVLCSFCCWCLCVLVLVGVCVDVFVLGVLVSFLL